MALSREAILYEKLPDNKVKCTACARYCEIKDSQIGLCGVRGNVGGKLELFVYGKVIVGNVDPIEKKPVIQQIPEKLQKYYTKQRPRPKFKSYKYQAE